jgi:hypothetical protein
MLNAVMLYVVKLSVIVLSDILLRVVILTVIWLVVVMVSVLVPTNDVRFKFKFGQKFMNKIGESFTLGLYFIIL